MPEPASGVFEPLLSAAQSEQRLPSVGATVFHAGEIVWEQALGLADVERGEGATLDHQYRVGSITKTFTAVLVMRLVAAGRFELDAPLRSLIPECRPGPTVRHALSHLSGLQREPAGEVWETLRIPTREELLAGLEDAELILQPGSAWHYSNLAFALLGEVVVRGYGAPFPEVVTRELLTPLGLTRSSIAPTGLTATPYFVDPYSDRVHVEPDLAVTETTSAAGWLWSTPRDLARWADFLSLGDERILAKAQLDRMATVEAMVDEASWTLGWGLGLELYRRDRYVLAGHGGAMPGFLAAFCVHRPTRTGSAVVMNTGAGAEPEKLALDLAEEALRRFPAPAQPWHPSAGVPDEIAPLLGRWWTEGSELILAHRGGRFVAELIGGPPGRSESILEADGVDRYRVVSGRERGELLRIVRDAGGAVGKLYFATYPLTRHASTFGEAAR